MKLSARALELLGMIDQASTWEGDVRPGIKLRTYWAPLYGRAWGSGDAMILRSLERKGLTRRVAATNYSYFITEDGLARLAKKETTP